MHHPFVVSLENDLGIGKLAQRNGDQTIVEYFRTTADAEPIPSPQSFESLRRKTLVSQTRVYWRDESGFAWKVGRVLDYQKDDECYLVRFPNDETRLIHSDELQVRCNLPIAEPTDHLAYQLNETAFWHSARSEFVRLLQEQHRVSGGLSALVSSSVDLVAHQMSVIQRVLLDPFQRYLLADEVGLGKTIEAGVLIKQFGLDQPIDHETLVIVPETLMIQWQQELTNRFHLGHMLGQSIFIVSSRDQSEISRRISAAKMIVIDEAHHISSWAWSSIPIESETFNVIRQATSDLGRRVLLLSATPVLYNEKSFLAMLHLLDPLVYPLDGLDIFKQRVQLRQEIAERMMDLREDESNFFLGDTLEVLGDLLADDQEFQSLRKELMELIKNDVGEREKRRVELIRSIRIHVSDMWRLHRRILRSRRTDSTSIYLPGRGGAKRIVYACANEKGLADAIEAWRLTLSASLYSASEPEKLTAGDLARMMDELASCEPRRALELASARLRGGVSVASSSLPLCEGEINSLEQIIRAAKDCDHAARLQNLYQLVGAEENQVSFVVFADAPETANLIFEFLQLRLPAGRVLRHSPDRVDWTQYKREHRGYVLVCDRAAEEGLNLQKRGACAIHYDLPFSPNRIEQRMGRRDRFGSGIAVQSAVLVCDGSNVQKRWFDLVEGVLGVFSRSIASLQYAIEDAMQQVLAGFLDSGADAFSEASKQLGGDEGLVTKELKRIRAQDAIDSFDNDTLTQEFADELENNDLKLGQASLKIFNDWMLVNLRFRSIGGEKRTDDVFTYEFTRKVDQGVRRPFGRDTLIPADEFERMFAESIDKLSLEPPAKFTTVPFTFDRVTSQRRSCRLLRVGDPFVDAFEKFTRWDDRGISYAFWRFMPNIRSDDDPAVYFKFDFVISPAIEPLEALCDRYAGASVNAVVRRSRSIMQPRFTTIWLDADFNRVTVTDNQMKLLKPAYNKNRTAAGQDFNLNRTRWDAAAELYDMSLWRDRCAVAREKSEKLLREQSGLPKWLDECVATATHQANQVHQQFRSRLAVPNGEIKSSLKKDLQFEMELLEAQIEAFRNPNLRVDSIGAIFLSNRMPFIEHEEAEDSD